MATRFGITVLPIYKGGKSGIWAGIYAGAFANSVTGGALPTECVVNTTDCFIPMSSIEGTLTFAYPFAFTTTHGEIGDNTVNANTLAVTGTFNHVSEGGVLTGLKLTTTASGSLGMWGMGLYCIWDEDHDSLTGFSTAGAFEHVVSGEVAHMHDSAVIDLRDNNTGTVSPSHPAGSYIRIRASGDKTSETGRRNFVNFYTEDVAFTYDSDRMLALTSDQTQTHSIRCFINDTVIYLMATTTAPAST